MTSLNKNIVNFVKAGLVAGAVIGLSACDKEAQEKSFEVATHQVETKVVEMGTMPLVVSLPGSIVPDQQARIASRLMGYIKTLPVEVGQKVKHGDLLFTIDSQDIRSQISQAKAGYQQAQAALENAKADFERFSELYKEESVSRQQFDGVRLQYSVAQENLAAAKAGLQQAEAQLNYANVRAPFDGIVVQKMASAGDLAAPGQPVIVLENTSSLSVQTEVSQDLYAVLAVGDKATIKVDGIEQAVEGEIYSLVSAANPRTRGHTTKLSLPAIASVNSGTFARIDFVRGEHQTLLVPADAIVTRGGIQGVFVVDKNQTAHFRMLRLGKKVNGNIEVQAGLDIDEVIVISNHQALVNGDKIAQ